MTTGSDILVEGALVLAGFILWSEGIQSVEAVQFGKKGERRRAWEGSASLRRAESSEIAHNSFCDKAFRRSWHAGKQRMPSFPPPRSFTGRGYHPEAI